MEPNWKLVGDQQVTALRSALWSGTQDLKVIPKLLRNLLADDLWKCRFVEQLQQEVSFDSFSEFVSKKAPHGLGTDVQTLKKFCQSAGDMAAVELIDEASKTGQGKRTDLLNLPDNVMEVKREYGNSSTAAVRTLAEKRPDLHQKVIAGEVSPHSAMVEAGLRVKSHTIPHDPIRAAAAILRHFSPAEVRLLIEELHRGS